MPDLSNLLGAVYGEGPTEPSRDPQDEAHVEHEPAADERGPAVPDWADDDHLDAAFAQWKPGPSEDASPAEHAFVNDADDDPPPPLADDLAAALSEALVAASGTADDTADPAPADPYAKPRFDFSAPVDEEDEAEVDEEPFAVFAPHHVDEAPTLSRTEVGSDEEAEAERTPAFGEVAVGDEQPEPEAVAAPEAEAQAPAPVEVQPAEEPADELSDAEPVEVPHHVDEEAEEPRPSITTQRAAAAELTAASRIDDPVAPAPEPAPVPDPEPVVSAPVAATPQPVLATAPVPGDGAAAPTALPAGTRRWDRADDDILPEKTAKKFFSFSLRRG